MSDSEDSIGIGSSRVRNLTEKGKDLSFTNTRGSKVVRPAIMAKTAQQSDKCHSGYDESKSLNERKNVSGSKNGNS